MFGNRKRRKREDEDQNYEYKFRRNGTVVQKPTDVGYSYAKIKKNNLLKDVEGADDYSDFTTNGKRGNLIYKFNNNSNLSDFNYAGNTRKEARGERRAEKGKSRKGTAFTINDDKVADELYRAVAGNSNVEYIKVGYHNDSDSRTKDYIATDKLKKNIILGGHMKPLINNSTITDVTHSHPFNYQGSENIVPGEELKTNTKFASKFDTDSYKTGLNVFKDRKTLNEQYNTEMPKYNTYHPWTYDEDKLPYTMEYNEKGTILPKGMEIGVTLEEYINRLGKAVDK